MLFDGGRGEPRLKTAANTPNSVIWHFLITMTLCIIISHSPSHTMGNESAHSWRVLEFLFLHLFQNGPRATSNCAATTWGTYTNTDEKMRAHRCARSFEWRPNIYFIRNAYFRNFFVRHERIIITYEWWRIFRWTVNEYFWCVGMQCRFSAAQWLTYVLLPFETDSFLSDDSLNSFWCFLHWIFWRQHSIFAMETLNPFHDKTTRIISMAKTCCSMRGITSTSKQTNTSTGNKQASKCTNTF